MNKKSKALNISKSQKDFAPEVPEQSVIDTWPKLQRKPHTIKINGFDVPAPFNPNFGEDYFWINPSSKDGFSSDIWANEESDQYTSTFGVWRTENEIKQVVTAYRKLIGAAHD